MREAEKEAVVRCLIVRPLVLHSLALGVLVLATPLRALAQSPALGDFSIAYGGSFSEHSSDSPATTPAIIALPLATTVSLSPIFTFHASTGSIGSVKTQGAPRATGFGDTKLGLTGSWPLPQADNVQIAGDYTVKLPTADSAKGLGSGFADHQLTVSPTVSFGVDGVNAVSADFGVDLVGGDQSRDPYFFTDGYFTRTLNKDNELDFEVDYTPAAHGNPSDGVFIVSAKRKMPVGSDSTRAQAWTITPGVTAGLVSSSSRWGAFINLTYSNSKAQPAGPFLAANLAHPAVGRHILGLGVSGSRR